jgi:2-amino-4-hydroxy-6-hydroxymethyldihydropteridine diphosphokinase
MRHLPQTTPVTVIGLGSNLGDRRAALEAAAAAIAQIPGLEIVGRSSVWRTRPVGGPASQPDYYNAGLAVHTTLRPEQLLGELLAIETRLGRVRSEPNAPRTIDLDILWVEGEEVDKTAPGWPRIQVPHPRLRERAFALVPLLEVAPGAADPRTGQLYAEVLAEIGASGVDPADP